MAGDAPNRSGYDEELSRRCACALKRSLRGTYVSVEPYHLSAYVDEQCYRFNHRKQTDGERFTRAMSMLKGCRLTYDRLTRAEQA